MAPKKRKASSRIANKTPLLVTLVLGVMICASLAALFYFIFIRPVTLEPQTRQKKIQTLPAEKPVPPAAK